MFTSNTLDKMAKVNSEGTNTEMMRRHAMNKKQVDTTKCVEVELGVEQSAGHKIFDFRLTNCLNAKYVDEKLEPNLTLAADKGRKYITSVEDILVPQDANPILVSDADSQLLLKIHFNEKVNISAISFRCDAKPTEDEIKSCLQDEDNSPEDFQPPQNVRFYVNHDQLDFSDIDDYKATEIKTLDLNIEEGRTIERCAMSGPKWTRVSTLQILVVDANEDAPYTFLNHVGITGQIMTDYHTSY